MTFTPIVSGAHCTHTSLTLVRILSFFFPKVFLSYTDLRDALTFPFLCLLVCCAQSCHRPAGSLCMYVCMYVIKNDACFHHSQSSCIRDVGCLVITSYPLIIFFLFQCLSLLRRSSCCSHLLLICLLCTILPSTLPAGSLCMYVIITDARFHCIRGSLQHTSLTLVRILSFFCELMGLSVSCLFTGSGVLSPYDYYSTVSLSFLMSLSFSLIDVAYKYIFVTKRSAACKEVYGTVLLKRERDNGIRPRSGIVITAWA